MIDLSGYEIILGSKSPRRKDLLESLLIPFTVKSLDTDETYPSTLSFTEIPEFLAEKKADAFHLLKPNEMVITADTLVFLPEGPGHRVLGKPADAKEAADMLRALSATSHQVVTGVSIKSAQKMETFSVLTEVTFSKISDESVAFYVARFTPFDKAGGYGVQDWIGLAHISRIDGSYTNVVGLPTEKLFDRLTRFVRT